MQLNLRPVQWFSVCTLRRVCAVFYPAEPNALQEATSRVHVLRAIVLQCLWYKSCEDRLTLQMKVLSLQQSAQ